MFYHFDIDKWIIHLLPPVLRKAFIYAFLRCMLYPVKQLQDAFLTYKTGVGRQLTYNVFQNSLERFLNSLFFFEYKAIYITDEEYDRAYLSLESEAVAPVYMSFQDESPATALNMSSLAPSAITGTFVVHVPAALSQADIATVTNWVNYYKMAGTEFSIDVYE
jgi:hypothetical protein